MPDSSFAYDAVPYPSAVFAQTHPDRLATIGRLLGMSPAGVPEARVLEIGCGDGSNLLGMACELPRAQFVGIDLSGQAIDRGQRSISGLGVTNLALHHSGVGDIPADLGRFDFILAHGLYSWVPAEVRDQIMAVCQRHLADQGIAYISYNAYPGNHLRDLVRHIIQFHARQFEAPAEQVRQARILVKFLATARPEPHSWQDILKQQSERLDQYTDEGLFHDDLGPINHPSYFHEFVEHAGRYGLQYLREADLADLLEDDFPEEVTAALPTGNRIIREQYLDFLKGRSFRQSLICREAVTLRPDLLPERVVSLFVAGEINPVQLATDPNSLDLVEFRGGRKAVIATGHPVAKAALLELGTIWPMRIEFQELLRRAQGRLRHPAEAADGTMTLAAFLVQAYSMGFLDLHSTPAAFVSHVSDRPMASALSRWQSERGPRVSTLRHGVLKVEDPICRELLRLLDGTHDRAELQRRIEPLVAVAAATPSSAGADALSESSTEGDISAQLDTQLQFLARSAVLVA